jgi:hypothetical protein
MYRLLSLGRLHRCQHSVPTVTDTVTSQQCNLLTGDQSVHAIQFKKTNVMQLCRKRNNVPMLSW